MDTERTFLSSGELDGYEFETLTPEDLVVVETHVEMARHIQEVHQLFRLFDFNVERFWEKFNTLNSISAFEERVHALFQEHCPINALVTNVISSGKTLYEAMECYIKQCYSKSESPFQEFDQKRQDVYDHCFSYRFLYSLRNYAQHGHIPVSLDIKNVGYTFNLWQILHKPHYDHKKPQREELSQIIEEVKKTFGDTPTLALDKTVAEFVDGILSLYLEFLKIVQEKQAEYRLKFLSIVPRYNSNRIERVREYENVFFYKYEDHEAHLVPVDQDIVEEMKGYLQEAEMRFSKYHSLLKEIDSHYIKLYFKEDRIELDFGEEGE